jgi:hypothetical protein
LLTAITFAGLGGFWVLFYSYWLRDKGSGMAVHAGHISGLAGDPAAVRIDGMLPSDDAENHAQWRRWRRFLGIDISVGVAGNLLTTAMACLLAYVLLLPSGLLPVEYEIAVVQSRFFEASLGEFGRVLFLAVAAAFLADTWLVTVDAVSRQQADIVQILFPAARRWSARQLYFALLGVFTTITCLTMPLATPGPLILISAVIGFIGTVIFPPALYLLNHRLLPRGLPDWARPSRTARVLLLFSFCAYLLLAAAYLFVVFS